MSSVTLASYDSPQEAYLVKGMLESNGIPAMVENLNNLYVPVFNGCNVVINSKYLDEARKLLAEHDGGSGSATD